MSELTDNETMIAPATKTMTPLNQRAVHIRVLYQVYKDKGDYDSRREPIFGIVQFAEGGTTQYRYLTTASDEDGTVPVELDPYWGAEYNWVEQIVFPDIQSAQDITTVIERLNKSAKWHWDFDQAKAEGREKMIAFLDKEEEATS